MKQFVMVLALMTLLCNSRILVAQAKPNVLFISIDDLNDWIGCLDGHPQALTPNIDRLAARGVLFTNAHCVAPACNPSRAAVLSGQLPFRTGIWSNGSKKLLTQHPTAVVLPRAFQQAGYQTLGTGKVLHGSAETRDIFEESFITEQRWSPLARDMVKYTDDELPSKSTSNPRHVVRQSGGNSVVLPLNRMPSDRRPTLNDGESFDWGPFDVLNAEMGDTKITTWAMRQLRGGFDKPFFMAVGYYRPHIPLWAPQKYFERFDNVKIELPTVQETDLTDLGVFGKQRATEAVTAGSHATVVKHGQWEEAVKAYLACTTYVDEQIGRLLEELDNGRYGDNTVIVLWSDHGWHLGEKEHWGKWTPWQRSTRVPLIVVPPKNMASYFGKNATCDAPVSLLDLYPTLLEMCGISGSQRLDGRSLVSLLRKPEEWTDRHAVTFFGQGNVSVKTGQWRYIQYAQGEEELYDQMTDPHEWDNLAGTRKYESVLRKLRKFVASTVPPAKVLSRRLP
ncbi:MAG: sulfatase [Pirellulaceae bacterium]|nr:sulfatase [Pirellulaceae bacterium]